VLVVFDVSNQGRVCGTLMVPDSETQGFNARRGSLKKRKDDI